MGMCVWAYGNVVCVCARACVSVLRALVRLCCVACGVDLCVWKAQV